MRSSSIRPKVLRRASLCASLLSLLAAPGVANAAVGPGIGNMECGDAEYFKPFKFIENPTPGPNGTNVAIMIRGYFMTIFAPDSGKPPGEIGLYDVSNPKDAKEVRHIENGDTNNFRESHSLPVALINGKHIIAIQSIKGIQFWDFTDPMTASKIGNIDLPGVNGGDYEDVAWQTSWQGRYLYVSGGNRGIYVVDAGDPTNPKLLKQVQTSSSGGFRVGPLFALGDYLVISNMDQGGAYAVLDISVPDEPALLAQRGNAPRMYAIAVGANDRIYTAGRDGNFLIHSFSDPTKIELVKNAMIGQDQLYAAVQDQYVFLGRQNNVIKVDVTDEQNPKVVGEGTLNRDHPDHGQVTPMGNLIYIGNDHGTGSAFFCHQKGKDVTPLAVQSTYPKDGTSGVPSTSRVSILFSDYVDLETLTPDSVKVRPAGGEPLDGIFTYAFNALSFGPSEPLAADTTYEVVLAADGLRDIMGNALTEEVIFRFSTGDSIVIPPPPEPEEPATGGSGGAGAGGSGIAGAPSSTGGSGAAGGAPAGTGGAPQATGGSGALGGATGGTGAPQASPSSSEGSCSVSVPGGRASSFGAAFALLSAALLRLRRGSRRA
jgi:hypothetical protein